jgi:hypothetical protein
MKSTIYIETTIPSYLVARPSSELRLAADQADTISWWEKCRQQYDLRISAIVLLEIRQGNQAMAELRENVLKEIPLLDPTPEAEAITESLLKNVIPLSAAADAAHIAIAAAHAVDFLLTWNCKHINNPHTIRRIERCCLELGFRCPVVATPSELLFIDS